MKSIVCPWWNKPSKAKAGEKRAALSSALKKKLVNKVGFFTLEMVYSPIPEEVPVHISFDISDDKKHRMS